MMCLEVNENRLNECFWAFQKLFCGPSDLCVYLFCLPGDGLQDVESNLS